MGLGDGAVDTGDAATFADGKDMCLRGTERTVGDDASRRGGAAQQLCQLEIGDEVLAHSQQVAGDGVCGMRVLHRYCQTVTGGVHGGDGAGKPDGCAPHRAHVCHDLAHFL